MQNKIIFFNLLIPILYHKINVYLFCDYINKFTIFYLKICIGIQKLKRKNSNSNIYYQR